MITQASVSTEACGDTQLLSVPKLPYGTGESQAHAIFQVLKEWNVQYSIEALYFDTGTTSSNTGRINCNNWEDDS